MLSFCGMMGSTGGFVDENEGLEAAARRELEEETGVTNCAMVQTGAYGGWEYSWWTSSYVPVHVIVRDSWS